MQLKQQVVMMATANLHKAQEVAAILGEGWQVRTLQDYPDLVLPPETGETFAENAAIKARAAADALNIWTLADDSGLTVDFLQGAPGIYSARYAGEPCNDAANNAKLLTALAGVAAAERTAHFICAIAIAEPHGRLFLTAGSCDGLLLEAPRGAGGFGYDPLFYLPKFGKTTSELTMEEKNEISHRGQALRAALPILQQNFQK